MISEPRQLLTTGVPVLSTDGRRGRLHQALLSPGYCRLDALVIRYGALLPRDVVVPLEQVADITDRQVRLRLSHAELVQLPTYQSAFHMHSALGGPRPALVAIQYGSAATSERIIEAPSNSALALGDQPGSRADGLIALRARQPVWIGTQAVGRLERLLLDSDHRVRQIIVRTSHMFGRHLLVAIDQVARCDTQGIWLALDHAAFQRLPDYRTDRAIARDVRQALWDDEVVRRLDRRLIDVAVGAGVVVLHGHTTTPMSRTRVERAALGVRGVLGVTNQIVTDGEIQIAVAQALARNERTRGYRLFVHVRRGVVYISGEVASVMARAVIEAVAGSIPQVRAVISHVEGNGDAAGDVRALFPRISQGVYTAETRLGQVAQVIIHPRHRRVTALVVRAWMADPQQTAAGVSLEPPAQQERQLVIPASAVREVTEAAVLLDIGDDAAMRYPDFDPAAYARPMPDWQPPYPYTYAEVLIEPNRPGAAEEWRDRSTRPEGMS